MISDSPDSAGSRTGSAVIGGFPQFSRGGVPTLSAYATKKYRSFVGAILPVDDFGVREGYRKLHTLETQPKPKELAAIGEMWSPWRSVASWYLWRAADEGRTIKQPQPAA